MDGVGCAGVVDRPSSGVGSEEAWPINLII